MEGLKQKIQADLIIAVKKDDKTIRSTLRMLLAAVLNKEKEKRYKITKNEPEMAEKELAEKSVLTDDEIIEVVAFEVKKRREAILEFEKGKREELVKKEKAEIEVLEKYLPKQFSEEKIKKLVKEIIGKVEAKGIEDIGKVMKEIMPKVKGKAEGSEVSKIVKELLSQ